MACWLEIDLFGKNRRALEAAKYETDAAIENTARGSAVETKHHLIVAHEVTNLGYDRDALSMMAHKARDVMASDTIEAIADKGYYKGEEIVACEHAGIVVTVPKPHTSNAAAVGRFDRADFVYHADEDAYLCPAGEWLTYHYTNEEAGKTLRSY